MLISKNTKIVSHGVRTGNLNVCGGYIGMWWLCRYVTVILNNCTSTAVQGS